MSKVRGKFETFEGTLVTDDDVTNSRVDVSVDLNSINTGTVDRDNHLRSSDFFEVENHPTMTFASTGVVEKAPGELVVQGDLTIKGVTKPVTVDFEYTGTAVDPYGNLRIGLEGTTTINRKDFGVSWNSALDRGGVVVGNMVEITIDAEAILQEG